MSVILQNSKYWFEQLTEEVLHHCASVEIVGSDGFSIHIPIQSLTASSPMMCSIISDSCLCSALVKGIVLFIPCATVSSLNLLKELFCSGKIDMKCENGSTLNMLEEIQCILDDLGIDKKFCPKLIRAERKVKKIVVHESVPARTPQPSTSTPQYFDVSHRNQDIKFKKSLRELFTRDKFGNSFRSSNNVDISDGHIHPQLIPSSATNVQEKSIIGLNEKMCSKLNVRLNNCLEEDFSEEHAENEELVSVKTEVSDYQCSVCGYYFTRKLALEKHVKRGSCFGSKFSKKFLSPPTLHQCPRCSMRYSSTSRLKKHLLKSHKEKKHSKDRRKVAKTDIPSAAKL